MRNFVLSCCSTADLTMEHFAERKIAWIRFHFELDGKHYWDDLGQTMSFETFYQAMKDGAMTKTSQINADEFVEYWEPFLKEGKDILHVTLSSGISGVLNSAIIAKSELEEKYPDRKLYVVDSLAAASGYGLLMDRLADLRDEGKTIDEVRDWAEANKMKLQHLVMVTDLTYLVRGGRVSKASGFFGNALNICPLICVDHEGKLSVTQKVRTKKKAARTLVEQMSTLADGGTDYDGKCYICHSACTEDAQMVADLVKEQFPKITGEVEIYNIGTTIGSHTGPGTTALFFWGKERTE
ncbi:MAG: DegV family protein [Lachnospiraceae bacterium]|nr:DegV family protein [Lachnospiraceae bacterium]